MLRKRLPGCNERRGQVGAIPIERAEGGVVVSANDIQPWTTTTHAGFRTAAGHGIRIELAWRTGQRPALELIAYLTNTTTDAATSRRAGRTFVRIINWCCWRHYRAAACDSAGTFL